MTWTAFWSNRLGRRIVAWIVIATAGLSAIAAGTQLYLNYERERARTFEEFSIIENSFLNGLENALWQFNFNQVEVLLDGIHAQPDIAYLRLDAETGQTWTRGAGDPGDMVLRHFDLVHADPQSGRMPVGRLSVGLSLAVLNTELWNQFLTVLVSNFLRAILAALIMLLIFDRLVARHLRAISRQVSGTSWTSSGSPVVLNRDGTRPPDDLDDIVASLNQSHAAAHTALTGLDSARQRLSLSNTRLREANSQQAEFTYAISHDLKSPVNTVLMLARELAVDEASHLSDDATSMLSDLTQTTTRMNRLIDDVLSYSRTVGEPMTLQEVDLNSVFESIQQDLRGEISAVTAEIRISELPTVKGHRTQLRMLFQNLVANAIKFRSPDRPPRITVRADTAPNGGAVTVFVADNGIGIDPEYRDRIFGLFQRLHTEDAYRGSGLGLTVCRRIASNHRGDITVSSEPGDGSTFAVVLPGETDGH